MWFEAARSLAVFNIRRDMIDCVGMRKRGLVGRVGVEPTARIDGLDRQLFAHVVRIRALKPSGNLFGRTPLSQMRPHVLPQPGIQEFARPPWLTDPSRCQGVRRAGPIGPLHRVAGARTAHGAGRGGLNTVAIVRNEWPWASPKLNVSRSSAFMCR